MRAPNTALVGPEEAGGARRAMASACRPAG